MAAKRIEFDQQAFVLDYVSGRITLPRLAAKYGISASLASKIVSGQRRPEVVAMIEEALESDRRQTQHQLVRLQRAALRMLDKAMTGKPTAISMAAVREVLKRTVPDEPAPLAIPPAVLESRERSLVDLSPETKRLVLEELGGPLPPD